MERILIGLHEMIAGIKFQVSISLLQWAFWHNGQSQAMLAPAVLDKDYGSSNKKRRVLKVLGSS
jgi:hypothetical protein